MKYCPNPTCPYAVKYRRPLDYRNDILLCRECGAALSNEVPVRTVGMAADEPSDTIVASQDVTRRLAVTLVAAVLIAVGMRTPLFGYQTPVMGLTEVDEDALRNFSLLSFGVAPFLSAFLVVELIAFVTPGLRKRRIGTSSDRAPLERAALLLGPILLVVQIGAMVRFMASMEEFGPATFPAPGLIWAQYLAAHLFLLALVQWVTRSGIVNGFALVVLVEALNATLTSLTTLRALLLNEALTPGTLFSVALLLVGGPAIVVWLSRFSRPSGELGPTAVPFPVSGLAPWSVAAVLVTLPMTLGTFLPAIAEFAHLLQSSFWIYIGVTSFLTLDATLLFGFLFFRPRAVGQLWAQWIKGIDEMGVIVRARALLPRALLLAGVVLVVALIGSKFLGTPGPMASMGGAVGAMIAGALVLVDLVDEWRARRRLGVLVSVRPLHRMAEVEPVSYVLRRAGIPFFTRSVAYRAALQFFGPYVPVEILVPRDRADEVRRMLDGA